MRVLVWVARVWAVVLAVGIATLAVAAANELLDLGLWGDGYPVFNADGTTDTGSFGTFALQLGAATLIAVLVGAFLYRYTRPYVGAQGSRFPSGNGSDPAAAPRPSPYQEAAAERRAVAHAGLRCPECGQLFLGEDELAAHLRRRHR